MGEALSEADRWSDRSLHSNSVADRHLSFWLSLSKHLGLYVVCPYNYCFSLITPVSEQRYKASHSPNRSIMHHFKSIRNFGILKHLHRTGNGICPETGSVQIVTKNVHNYADVISEDGKSIDYSVSDRDQYGNRYLLNQVGSTVAVYLNDKRDQGGLWSCGRYKVGPLRNGKHRLTYEEPKPKKATPSPGQTIQTFFKTTSPSALSATA